jgi:hypothetical protein
MKIKKHDEYLFGVKILHKIYRHKLYNTRECVCVCVWFSLSLISIVKKAAA